jgi:hypothetical protein
MVDLSSEDHVSKAPPTEIAVENLEPQDTTDFTNDDENQIDASTEMFVCPINVPADHQTPYTSMLILHLFLFTRNAVHGFQLVR